MSAARIVWPLTEADVAMTPIDSAIWARLSLTKDGHEAYGDSMDIDAMVMTAEPVKLADVRHMRRACGGDDALAMEVLAQQEVGDTDMTLEDILIWGNVGGWYRLHAWYCEWMRIDASVFTMFARARAEEDYERMDYESERERTTDKQLDWANLSWNERRIIQKDLHRERRLGHFAAMDRVQSRCDYNDYGIMTGLQSTWPLKLTGQAAKDAGDGPHYNNAGIVERHISWATAALYDNTVEREVTLARGFGYLAAARLTELYNAAMARSLSDAEYQEFLTLRSAVAAMDALLGAEQMS